MSARANEAPKPGVVLYVLDLLGVAVFAVSGALAAGKVGMDLLGVLVIAALTAIGGGTIRDLLLGRQPIFWIADPRYLHVIGAATLLTVVAAKWHAPPYQALLVADALGLALFALSGAQVAQGMGRTPSIVVLMGTMTGVGGGVLRDLLTGVVPLILRRDIYATAAIAGIVLYLLLQKLGLQRARAAVLGMITVVALRVLAILWGWQLPVFELSAPAA